VTARESFLRAQEQGHAHQRGHHRRGSGDRQRGAPPIALTSTPPPASATSSAPLRSPL
jgi:hypothetical protein